MTTYDVINPATEQLVTSVEQLDLEATEAAIALSRKAFQSWRAVAPGDRARLLRRFAVAVDGDLENLAQLEVANSGHTIGNASWEAGNVRDVIAYYSGAPERLIGQQIPVADGLDVTFHEPLGVVGAIVPWNFPMPIASWAFAPALAAGNTVVLKPAELTPLTAIRLAELALEAGIPEGVFQVLPGKGSVVGQCLVDHPDVAKIVFTGSTEVGRKVMTGCAQRIKPVTLELGGKSANVVFADADLETAAATAPYAVFDNAGQDCCARSRILVERSAYEKFMELFEAAVKAVVVADPADVKTEMGPLISAAQRERVAAYVPNDDQVAFRGSAPSGAGYWFPPTSAAALAPLSASMSTHTTFAPSAANRRAVARPIPLPAPVTTATFSASLPKAADISSPLSR
jgi:acyl-CoA reductase-like NAD-dependent aldehyde dehydrogenase